MIFCPPGPEPLRKASVRDASGVGVRGGSWRARGRVCGRVLGRGVEVGGLGIEGRGVVVERGRRRVRVRRLVRGRRGGWRGIVEVLGGRVSRVSGETRSCKVRASLLTEVHFR